MVEKEQVKQNRFFSGVGGRLMLTPEGVLCGVGWDLRLPYGVDYDPAAAMAAPPVRIAEGVISAAAGYNHGLYVTEDGALHFVGSSGIPFAERFSFDGRIREVFAAPDRDTFSLTDENGERWVWGDNTDYKLAPHERVIRAAVNDQTVTRRAGKAIWRYRDRGVEKRSKGLMAEVPAWEVRALLRRRVSENAAYRALSDEYGEDNILLKYVRRDKSPEREIRSDNWSEADYEQAPGKDSFIPIAPGIRDRRMEAYSGIELSLTYSVCIYTENRYLFKPIPELADCESRKRAQNFAPKGNSIVFEAALPPQKHPKPSFARPRADQSGPKPLR